MFNLPGKPSPIPLYKQRRRPPEPGPNGYLGWLLALMAALALVYGIGYSA